MLKAQGPFSPCGMPMVPPLPGFQFGAPVQYVYTYVT